MPQSVDGIIDEPNIVDWRVFKNDDADFSISIGGGVVVLADSTTTVRTISLPSAALSLDRVIVVKKIDATANAVVVDGDGSETIDGAATHSLVSQYDSVTLVCDGVEWFIISIT